MASCTRGDQEQAIASCDCMGIATYPPYNGPDIQTWLDCCIRGCTAAVLERQRFWKNGAQSYRLLLRRLGSTIRRDRSGRRCAAVSQLPEDAQWLPRIGNNHGFVTAKLRLNAWHSMVDSCAAVSCAPVKECEQSKGAAIIKDFVTGTVAVEEGVDRCV